MFTLLARKQYHTQQTSMQVFTGAILQVSFLHFFQSYPGRYMCHTLIEKQFSHMVYLYMILTVLWTTDSRGATTKPEKRTKSKESCIALISRCDG